MSILGLEGGAHNLPLVFCLSVYVVKSSRLTVLVRLDAQNVVTGSPKKSLHLATFRKHFINEGTSI